MTERESEGDTDRPPELRRAFEGHGSFARDGQQWVSETTPFAAAVRAEPDGEERTLFTVTVRVPTLSAATADEVAAVVEEGWAETFELRSVDVGGVTRRDREFDPTVAVGADEVAVTYEFADRNARRGVDDAGALIDFVEGTYVQGVIPGYEYVDPVAGLVADARRQGNDDAV